ncbi:hypothetical protein OA010_03365 [Luminiphilus sp.]|nr:hypothetical protein [Luminiphilus sp.]
MAFVLYEFGCGGICWRRGRRNRSLKYGYTIYDGEKIPLSNLGPMGVVFTAVRDYVVGAITAERGASRNIHFGAGPTYLGLIAFFYWLSQGGPLLYLIQKNEVSEKPSAKNLSGANLASAESNSDQEQHRDEMRIRGISQLEADKVAEEPRSDVYADELKLFEDGELD